MLVSELYEQVAGLGFEVSLESESVFYNATNRALLQVSAIRPAIRSCVINHKPLYNAIEDVEFSPIFRDSTLIYEANNVKSFYFEVSGLGYVYIEKYNEGTLDWDIINDFEISSNNGTPDSVIVNDIAISSNGTFTVYRGFIKDAEGFIEGRVRLRFEGEFTYTLKGVAMYRSIYSDSVEDIPAFEEYTAYDLSAIVDDFQGIVPGEPEKIGEKSKPVDYRVENGRILYLPYQEFGCFKVKYQHKPKKIEITTSPSSDNTLVDLDSDLCALLPLLIASYVWLEDEPEKAEYYRYMYQQGAAEIERKTKNASPVRFINRNGW